MNSPLKPSLALLCFIGISFQILAQDLKVSKIDSLFIKAEDAKNTLNRSLRINFLKQAKDLAYKNNDTLSILKAHKEITLFYCVNHVNFNLDSANFYGNKGLKIATQNKNRDKILYFKYLNAKIFLLGNNYEEAYKAYNELELELNQNDIDILPEYYMDFARLHHLIKEDAESFKKMKKAIAINESRYKKNKTAKIYNGLAVGYNNLGILYKVNKQLDSSLLYYKKSLAIKIDLKDTVNIAYAYNNIGKVYVAKNEPNKALYYYKKALEINPTNPSKNLLNNFSELHITQGKYKEAETALVNTAISAKDDNIRLDAFKHLLTLYKTQGRYQKALLYSDSMLIAREQLLNTTKISEIEKLKAEHDTEKKARQIELLSEQNKNQELKLRQIQILIVSMLISVVLLIVIINLFWRSKIFKAKASKLRIEQQLLRSQMNPHFIFNALSNIQTNILKNENEKAASYLSKFSKLVRSILENTQKSKISFSEELEAIEHYLELQKSRFENRFNYNITIDTEIDEDFTMIPTMLYQPIIENAIEHGIESVDSGTIDINFSLKDKHIHCTVLDNGIGYSNTQDATNSHKTSMSTKIIKNRLAYYSKKLRHPFQYNIKDHLKSQAIIGTIAHIDIPIIDY